MTKTKTLGFMIASLFALILLASLGSAITLTSPTTPVTLNPQTNATFTLNSDTVANFTEITSPITLTDSDSHSVTLTLTALGDIDNVTSVTYDVNATGDLDSFNFPESASDTIEFTIVNYTNSSFNDTKTVTFKFENTDYCEDCENIGNDLKINIEGIETLEGFGDDEVFWYLYDVIEVEVLVENTGVDIDNLDLEWVLYNAAGKKIQDGDIDKFDLDDGDEETVYFEFRLDRNINDFDGEDAVLYVKAKGKIDDSDSVYDDNETCDSDKEEIEIKTNDDFLVLGDIAINGVALIEDSTLENPLQCGAEFNLDAEIVNIGDEDQEDLSVRIYNNELGISEIVNFDKIKKFKDSNLVWSFTLPSDAEEGIYVLNLEIYDEDNDLYQNNEDDEAKFVIFFEISGNCAISEPLVSASLDSEAKAGKELIVNVLITNTEDREVTFTLNPADYTSWASLEDMSAALLTLNAGEAKEVTLTFSVEKGVEGAQTFDLEILEGSEFILSQAISVDIEDPKFNLFEFLKDYWLFAGLGVLILILIIAIIIVAVKASRR
jgi:hypothetical protein